MTNVTVVATVAPTAKIITFCIHNIPKCVIIELMGYHFHWLRMGLIEVVTTVQQCNVSIIIMVINVNEGLQSVCHLLYCRGDGTTACMQKLKGYSNPAGGHLTFISQWNLTKINAGIVIQVIKMYM